MGQRNTDPTYTGIMLAVFEKLEALEKQPRQDGPECDVIQAELKHLAKRQNEMLFLLRQMNGSVREHVQVLAEIKQWAKDHDTQVHPALDKRFDIAHHRSYAIHHRGMPLEREIGFFLERMARMQQPVPDRVRRVVPPSAEHGPLDAGPLAVPPVLIQAFPQGALGERIATLEVEQILVVQRPPEPTGDLRPGRNSHTFVCLGVI